MFVSTGSDWYSAGETIDTNVTVYLILPWVLVSRKALFCPEALTPVSKHLPHLGYQGLSACQWNYSRYQIKAAWLHLLVCPGQWMVTQAAWLSLSLPALPACWAIFHRFLGSSEEWNSVLTKNYVSSPPSSPALTWPMCPVVVHPLSTICCPLSVSDIKLSLSNTFLTLSRQFGHFPDITNTFQTLQTLSRHYRHFPDTSDTFQTLPRDYRHFPEITDTFQTLQTISRHLRHFTDITNTFQTLQTLCRHFRHFPDFSDTFQTL